MTRPVKMDWKNKVIIRRIAPSNYAPVAQLDRVLGYEPSGREFESLQARHKIKHLQRSHFRQILSVLQVCFLSRTKTAFLSMQSAQVGPPGTSFPQSNSVL